MRKVRHAAVVGDAFLLAVHSLPSPYIPSSHPFWLFCVPPAGPVALEAAQAPPTKDDTCEVAILDEELYLAQQAVEDGANDGPTLVGACAALGRCMTHLLHLKTQAQDLADLPPEVQGLVHLAKATMATLGWTERGKDIVREWVWWNSGACLATPAQAAELLAALAWSVDPEKVHGFDKPVRLPRYLYMLKDDAGWIFRKTRRTADLACKRLQEREAQAGKSAAGSGAISSERPLHRQHPVNRAAPAPRSVQGRHKRGSRAHM